MTLKRSYLVFASSPFANFATVLVTATSFYLGISLSLSLLLDRMLIKLSLKMLHLPWKKRWHLTSIILIDVASMEKKFAIE